MVLNDLELAYWHGVNMGQQIFTKFSVSDMLQKLWANAILTKTHITCPEESVIFRAYFVHNYPQIMKNFCKLENQWGKSENWLSFVQNESDSKEH